MMADDPPHHPRKLAPRTGTTRTDMPAVSAEPMLPSTPPPAEIARQWQVLGAIHEDVRAIRSEMQAGFDDHGRQLREHSDEIRELRENATVGREVRAELKEVRSELRENAKSQNALTADIRALLRSDASQTVDLGKLEAKLEEAIADRVTRSVETRTTQMAEEAGTTAGTTAGAEAGAEAGKQAGKWSRRVAVVLSITATIAATAKACEEGIKAARQDMVTPLGH
jgi:chromosome segregation ATPase